MSAGTQARTVFAGFGVSGSLLAAVGAAFLVAGGVLAFDQWPHAELRASNPESFSVAAASPSVASKSAAQARAVALPPAALALRPVSPGRNAGAARRPDRASSGRPHVVPVGTIPAVGTTQITPAGTGGSSTPVPGPAGPAPAPNPVADTVQGVTNTAARTVRAVGVSIPAASSVTQTVADTADQAGALVSSVVRGLTGGR